MKYSTALSRLQNLINTTPSVGELSKITGIAEKSLYARRSNDREFSEEEIAKIEQAFGVSLISNEDCIEIEHIHISPSCGKGTLVIDEPIITPIKLGTKMLQEVLRVSNPYNLKTFYASGDSMEPIIDDGNLLLVDLGRSDYNNGGVFVITINNEWYVKRLRKRLSGELDIISDNSEKYPIETYKPDDNIEIVIKGKVIKNLSKGL